MNQSLINLLELVWLWLAVEYAPRLAKLLNPSQPKRSASHPLSQVMRPLVEARRFRLIVGSNLVAAVVLVNAMGPIGGPVATGPVEVAILTAETTKILTETTFRFPLADSRGISQGFNRRHPGVDIQSPRGTNIYPLAAGTVVEVEVGRFGYGRKIIVAHAGGIRTLYAHLDKINMKLNDEVTRDTVIGAVGMTGWTTGPHLHLEISSPEGVINPTQVLPGI